MSSSDVPEALLVGLNPEQRRAVCHRDGPLCIIAGPGSGKTRVLTHRVAALLATGAEPWEILVVTFTNKAAAELRERLGALIGDAPLPWVGTFHSVCARILRTHHVAAGLPGDFAIADADAARKLLAESLTACGLSAEREDLRRAAGAIGRARNAGAAESALAGSPRTAAFVAVLADYRERLEAAHLVDFDGLLERTDALLGSDPEVLSYYQDRLSWVLCDEHQDASRLNHRLAVMLASGTRALCVVGDPDQSLYSWRSASPEVFDWVAADYPEATVVVLERNYRSSGSILTLASAVISQNPSPRRPRLTTDAGWGLPVEAVVASDDVAEADFIAALARGGGEVAVLVRTNAQTRALEEAATRAGVAYTVVGGQRFFDRAEVRTALAWLRCATGPGDATALARAAATPPRGVGTTALAQVADLATERRVPVVVALRDGVDTGAFTGRSATPLARFATDLAALGQVLADHGPAAALEHLAGPLGLRDALRRGDAGADRAANLDELIDAAAGFGDALDGRAAARAFLEHVALTSSADDGDSSDAPVAFVTVHAAKGREWDTVVVAGCDDGLFPHHLAGTDPDALAEERRLLYVALTRARVRLVLTRAERRLRHGRYEPTAPSPFLARLPDSLLRWRDLDGPRSGHSPGRHGHRHRTRPSRR